MNENRHQDLIVHLTRMESKIETIEERVKDTHRMVRGHDEILRGNGQPGLRSDVEALKTAQRKRDKIFGTALIFIVLAGIKILFGIE